MRFSQVRINYKYSHYVYWDGKLAATDMATLLCGLVKSHQRVVSIEYNHSSYDSGATVVLENYEVEVARSDDYLLAYACARNVFDKNSLLNPAPAPTKRVKHRRK